MRWVRRLGLLGLLILAAGGWATPAGASQQVGWTWPLAGSARVAHGFAPPPEPWLAGHRGVDLLGRSGEAVRAAGDGVVQFAGRVAGVGVVSVLHPDGRLTTYQPVRPVVRRGASVRRGQVIGRLTRRGTHCAPSACLHWGLRRGTAYLDPLALVGAQRVRLLPLHDRDAPAPTAPVAVATLTAVGSVSRAGRRACRAAAARLWCASGRSGSR